MASNHNYKNNKRVNSNKSIIFDKKDVKVESGNLPPKQNSGREFGDDVKSVLNHRYEAVAKKQQKLFEYLNDYIMKCKEGMTTGMYFLDPKYTPSVRKSEIVSIALIAEPTRQATPGSIMIMLRTKTQGIIPPSHLSDFPLPQVEEFCKHTASKLAMLGL